MPQAAKALQVSVVAGIRHVVILQSQAALSQLWVASMLPASAAVQELAIQVVVVEI